MCSLINGNSFSCCGDGLFDQENLEICDNQGSNLLNSITNIKGVGCKSDCACDASIGYIPTSPITINCTCDSAIGYVPTSPISTNCTLCGNNVINGDEPCDGGVGCRSDCTCDFVIGYAPTSPISTYCTLCGNNVINGDEPCHGGVR